MRILSIKNNKFDIFEKPLKTLQSWFPFSQPEMAPLPKAFREKKWGEKMSDLKNWKTAITFEPIEIEQF